MTTPLVVCEGLVHIYKAADIEVVALQGLDLVVAPGEAVAIVGRSGSGKTTLMNILSGVEPPTAGRASVGGRDLARMTEGEREAYRREVVGYVRQHSHANLADELDALTNVEIPMLGRLPAAERRERARTLLDRLGIAHRATNLPPQLSGGEAQRLSLAVALANRPALLLADEATAELDSVESRRLLGDLREMLADTGTAAVMVTHDHTVESYVDRVIQIRDGRTSTETRSGEELAIMDRAGRLQLPRAYVEKLGLGSRVRLVLRDGHIEILPLANIEERHEPVEGS